MRTLPAVLLALPLVLLAAGCPPKNGDGNATSEEKDSSGSAETKAGEAKRPETASATAEKKNVPPPKLPGALPAPEDVAAPPPDAKRTNSGLAYKVLREGTSDEHPRAQDTVKVHYSGWTTDGHNFDNSYKRGRPATFPLNRVIPGWTEGVQLMTPGSKYRFWIPEELAYKGVPGRPQGMLVFDIELLEIQRAAEPPPVPEDVAGPPKDAKKTKSGLAYKVLKKGTGKTHPRPNDVVEVHYTGWTTDGKMFDSSVTRGRPAQFPLDRVIPGWTEGLQLMVEGEKARLWIPEELAYKGRPGAPKGMLVFDVELLDIKEELRPPEAPPDVAGPPKDAKRTASGLAYKVLKEGKGDVHPKPEDTVVVHYTGWTTDGKSFDSSIPRGRPARFQLNRVIPGWTEGVQLMTPGSKYRFWIPEKLAYKGRPGAPQGMLVFDVELLDIVPAQPAQGAPAGGAAPAPSGGKSAAAGASGK
ncbi:MAG: FKBP-type peptidylprolyl isomerase [Deltaproteobacteria bacterium]|nr:MAG: FKBP-type peptidylprolyl isomerase [Deltaproteobacteria bacterium]